MTFEIIKCHGSGNDFVLLDERRLPIQLTQDQRTALAIQFCNRKSIIGADSFLFVQASAVGDGKMRYFNADGSEANMSGNGLRCVARYLSDDLKKESLVLEALGGVYAVERIRDFFDGVEAFSIKITTVDLAVKSLPLLVDSENWIDKKLDFLSEKLRFSALSVPNPQLVAKVDALDESLLIQIGSRCNNQRDFFPEGVNVNFFLPLDNHSIFVQTYERGCGITFSCGTGMFASSIVSTLLGYTPENEWLTVLNQGGFVKTKVYRNPQSQLVGELLGNTTNEFTADLHFDFADLKNAQLENMVPCTAEVEAYAKVKQFASDKFKVRSKPV